MAVVMSLVATAAPALAAGETYTWKSATDVSSFTGTSGGVGEYTSPVTFSRTATSGGGATYTGTAQYTCPTDNSAHTDKLTITLDATNYNNGKPVEPATGVLTGAAPCADFNGASIDYPNTNPVTGVSSSPPSCDQGALSFLFCPLIENISQNVSNIAINILTPLLQVNVITPTSVPQLYQVWTHVRDFADVLFILVFFAIIASTILQQDIGGLNPYTIKTIWVRLILATIMVQASFLISGLIVDIGNVMGLGVGSLMGLVTGGANTPAATLTNFTTNLLGGSVAAVAVGGIAILTTWEIAIPVLLGILLSLLVAFLTLGARFLFISILIVISPIACVAWVLPNTRHYMNDWMKLLMRLVMMFPIIIGVFALAGVVNEILPFSSDSTTGGAAKIAAEAIKPLITIAAFLVIPETFKLAGKGLERAYGILNGASGKSRSVLKNSQMYKDGQNKRRERQASMMQSLATNANVTALTGSDSRIKRAAGSGLLTASGLALAGAPNNQKKIQKAYKNVQAERTKTLKDFDNIPANLFGDAVLAAYGNRAKMDKTKREAPVLLEYMDTLAGRSALATQANSFKVFTDEHMRQVVGSSRNGDMPTIQTALAKNNYAEMPHIQRLDTKGMPRPDYAKKINAYTVGFFANTLDSEVWESTIGQKSVDAKTGDITYVQDARSRAMAKGWAENTASNQVQSMFDPHDRAYRSIGTDKRSFFTQMVGANYDEFKKYDKGRATLAEVKKGLNHQENADFFKDYYKNVLHTAVPKDTHGVEFDPQNNFNHFLVMKKKIEDHLSR